MLEMPQNPNRPLHASLGSGSAYHVVTLSLRVSCHQGWRTRR